MLNRFLPKEENFFVLFGKLGVEMAAAAEALATLFADVGNAKEKAKAVEAAEKRADMVVAKISNLLHVTFITPFDRDQINLLTSRMDDVVDLMEDVAQSVVLYNVTKLTPEAEELELLCAAAVKDIVEMVGLLSNMKNAKQILWLASDINRIEGEADYVMRAAVATLFRQESDYRDFIKMKEIYELLETVTDRADDVADIAKGVVLENT